MSHKPGKVLLPIARSSIGRALGRPHEAPENAPWLQELGACFVTLTQQGQLRGCIGSLQAHRSLLVDVKANAVAAALHDPRFAPLAALGLVPLAASVLRAGPRRAAQAALAVLTAGVVAGLRHASLPFTGARPPLGVGVAGAANPLDVAGSLARAAAAHPALLVEAAAFAAIALVLPFAQARGRWGAAGLGAAMLVLTVLAVPSAAAAPLVAAAWLTAAVVAVRATRD